MTVERWNGGTVERWNGGTVERWNGGTVERWNGGTVERWNGGTVERRNGGTELLVVGAFPPFHRSTVPPFHQPSRVNRHYMIPISDENPTLHTPVMTWLILGAMFAVWFVVQGGGFPGTQLQLVTSICNLGMIPGELTHRVPVGFSVPIAPGFVCAID